MSELKRWDGRITVRLHSPDDFRRLREARGLLQRELADAVRCTRGTIGHLETGVMSGVSVELASAIAWRLDVPLGSLFVVPDGARIEGDARVQRKRRPAPGR